MDDNEVRINGLSLFQQGVNPAWEDEVNKHGGEVRIDFKAKLNLLQKVWDKLVLAVVGGEFEIADYIAGIRLLDKSQSGRESIFRIEIWTKFNDQEANLVTQLKSHLEKEYI